MGWSIPAGRVLGSHKGAVPDLSTAGRTGSHARFRGAVVELAATLAGLPHRLAGTVAWKEAAIRLRWWAVLVLAGLAAVAVDQIGPSRAPPRSEAGGPELTDTEVARLFDRPLPGLSGPVVVSITGHKAADRRIRDVALERGYRLRGSPLDPLGRYNGWPLQQSAIDDLVDLQEAMFAEAGVRLSLRATYRDTASQRHLFLSRLSTNSLALRGRRVTNREIASGLADDVLQAVLRRAAPPGFSKHHTGYSIDVESSGLRGFGFRNSAAWRWLSENRYENAMRYGWIPSYPERAVSQGPIPEPWEWVWIGRDAAACARARECAVGALDQVSEASGSVVGWVLRPQVPPLPPLRLVTSDTRIPLEPTVAGRPDVALVYGLDSDRVGFTASTPLGGDPRWACVEAQVSSGGPWSRLGCIEPS